MNADLQKAIVCYCCGRDFASLLNECVESGYRADYFVLSIFTSLKIVKARRYENWDIVVETLEACVTIFERSRVSRLARTAKFKAWLVNAALSIQLLNEKHKVSLLLMEHTMALFLEDFKESQNQENVQMALSIEKFIRESVKNPYAIEVFKRNIWNQLESFCGQLLILLESLEVFIIQAYLERYADVLPEFVRSEDGEYGPDEATLRCRIRQLESHQFSWQFSLLNHVIIEDSQRV